MKHCNGLGQKVPMAILSNEGFSQNFELYASSILRNQSSISQQRIMRLTSFWSYMKAESMQLFMIPKTQNYERVPYALNCGDASHIWLSEMCG